MSSTVPSAFSGNEQTLLPKVLMVQAGVSGSGTGYFLGDYNHSERSLVAFHRVFAGKPYSDAEVRCLSRPQGCSDI